MSPSEATRGLDDLALAVYLERLFQGRRVLWLGDASTGAPARASRVASSVLAADPRAITDRVERDNLSIVRLSQGSPLPAGPYDVVVVPDLPATGLATPDRIRQLSGALAPGGVLVVASSNTDAMVRLARASEVAPLAYDALYDLLAQRFPAVRMLGQAPFVGYTVADFSAAGEPSVVFDGSLLGDGSEAPERFIALCGDTDVVLDAYAVVQVPARAALSGPIISRTQSSFESDTERQLGVLRDEVRAARERAEHLSRELDEERSKRRRPRTDERPLPTAALGSDPRIADLEAQLAAVREQLDAGNAHAEELESTLSQRTAALADLDGELERQRMELGSVRDESETRVSALRIAREELEQLRATPAPPPEDYIRIEASLRDRGQEILALHAEIERRATLARDLIEELRGLREGQLIDETSATADAERRIAEAEAKRAQVEAQLHTLRAEREAAVQRALRADTERTEAGFRADEALGKLAEIAAEQSRVDEERGRREAELSGFVRGLRARAAELEEMRGQAEARLALLRIDVDAGKLRELSLERALADMREQFELQLVRATSAPTSDASAEVEQLRGERDGLRARVEDREAALAALRSATPAAAPASAPVVDLAGPLAAAETERAVLASRVSELTAQLSATEARASNEGERANELAARVLTRENTLQSLEADAEDRERDAQSAAARADSLETDVQRLTEALGDARASLTALGASIGATSASRTRAPVSDSIEQVVPGATDAASSDANEASLLRQRIEAMTREASDRDVLLRSVTAQLQERDERTRTLEQQLAGSAPPPDADAEVRRLHELLGGRDAELLLVQGKMRGSEREIHAVRDTVAQARAGLEVILASATTSGDASTAERVGALLRLLSRY